MGLILGLEGGRKANQAAEALRARLTAVLHCNLSGFTGIVSRSAKVWQMRLRSEGGPITLGDLSEVATSPMREARTAIHELCGVLLEAIRPTDGTLVGEAIAAVARELADLLGEHAKALDDGRLDEAETERLIREVDEGQRALACARAALEGHRRRLAS